MGLCEMKYMEHGGPLFYHMWGVSWWWKSFSWLLTVQSSIGALPCWGPVWGLVRGGEGRGGREHRQPGSGGVTGRQWVSEEPATSEVGEQSQLRPRTGHTSPVTVSHWESLWGNFWWNVNIVAGLDLSVRLQVIIDILTSQWKHLIDWSENYQQEKEKER